MNKSENEFNASEKKIIEALEECTALSLGGLQRQTGMSMRAVANAVRNLEEKGIIKRRATQDGAYYFLAKMTYGQMQNGAVLTNAVVNAKVTNEMLEKEIEQVRGEMKSLYANIISLMGIFVSIFALIVVNANITFSLTSENMREVFWGIIVMNVVVVGCILALLIGIRFILVGKLLKKNDNKDSTQCELHPIC